MSLLRLGGKWPELAKEALPGLTRIGYLVNPTNASSVSTRDEARRSAEALGIDFRSYPIERPEDLESAFAVMARDSVSFLLLDASHPYPTDWPRVAELALRHKLPAISESREFAAAGGLMSYGASVFDMARRMATYIDKILQRRQGRRPSSRTGDQIRSGHKSSRPRRQSASLCHRPCSYAPMR